MPNWTLSDSWWTFPPSEAVRQEPTPAPSAEPGTSLQRYVLAEQSGSTQFSQQQIQELLRVWDGTRYSMLLPDGSQAELKLPEPEPSIEDYEKNVHNPRGLKLPLNEPVAFFKKDLPVIGGKHWLRFINQGWTFSYAQPCNIMANDESTVFLQGVYGLCGYVCTCMWCKKAVSESSEIDEGIHRGRAAFANEWNYSMTSRVDHTGTDPRFRKVYIGHIGELQRAATLALVVKLYGREVQPAYINHSSDDGGLLLRRGEEDITSVLHSLPEIREFPEPELPPPEPPEPTLPIAAPAWSPRGEEFAETLRYRAFRTRL